jgi:hypothetical protein
MLGRAYACKKHKTMKQLLILVIGLFWCIQITAQTRGFSKRPEIFIEELGTHMKSTKELPAELAYENFKKLWVLGKYNEEQQNYIMRSCEEMFYNKKNVNPDFALYLKTLTVAKDSAVAETKINNWLKASLASIQSLDKQFVPFMQASLWIFSDNSIYVSESKKWLTSVTDYTFSFNKDKGISVSFKNIDLFCKTADDEIWIRNTEGTWNVIEQTFTGKKGQIDWSRVGLGANEVWAELSNYKIDLTKAEFKADSVWLRYDKLIGDKLIGSLEDKASFAVLSSQKEDFTASTFPRFVSTRKDVTLAKFSSGKVVLKGGFEQLKIKHRLKCIIRRN